MWEVTTHAPRGPRDCELLSILACAVECVSFPLLCRPHNITSPKWTPTTCAPGLPKTTACAVSLHGPLQLQIWAPFPTPAPIVPRQSVTFSRAVFTFSEFHSKFLFHLGFPSCNSRSTIGSHCPTRQQVSCLTFGVSPRRSDEGYQKGQWQHYCSAV